MTTHRRKFMAAIAALSFFGRRAKAKDLASSSEILKSFDARDWARHFVEHVKAIPSIATDEETMTTWFANALMRGWDQAHFERAFGETRPAGETPNLATRVHQVFTVSLR